MNTVVLPKLPSMFKLRLKAIMPKKVQRNATSLPETTYTVKNIKINAKHLAHYNKVCGFADASHVSACYPFYYAMPIVNHMVAIDSFPFKVLGMVHYENSITKLKAINAGDVIDVATTYAPEIEIHEKGRIATFLTEITRDDEIVWHAATRIFFFVNGHGEKDENKQPDEKIYDNLQTWSLPNDLGKQYADVSEDRNPIHLGPKRAKLFGFKRHIIHGMWTKAHCEAALTPQLPESYKLDITFKTPVFLPSTVRFTAEDLTDGELNFELRDNNAEKPHARGKVTFL